MTAGGGCEKPVEFRKEKLLYGTLREYILGQLGFELEKPGLNRKSPFLRSNQGELQYN